MTALYRYADLPRRRPRQGHRRGEICRRIQRAEASPMAAVVASTIAKGRIARIDASEALQRAGVLDVLTHENRPRMADNDRPTRTMSAPEQGSPFRPLYDDRIKFSGQPIALVVAEEWEIARFAASLVRVEYAAGSTTHRSSGANATRPSWSRSPKSRAATPTRPSPRPPCGTRPNISFRPSTTIRWSCLPRP